MIDVICHDGVIQPVRISLKNLKNYLEITPGVYINAPGLKKQGIIDGVEVFTADDVTV